MADASVYFIVVVGEYMIHFSCQHCNELLEAPDSLLGEHLECPQCHYENVVSPSCVVENKSETLRYPWVVERLLYPASVDGLVCIGLVWGVPLLVNLIRKVLASSGLPGVSFLSMGLMGIEFLIGAYFWYYLAECLRDSALGGLRAPNPMERSSHLDWQELIWHVVVILGCLALCAGPAIGYRIVTESEDWVFYLLAVLGVMGFPMMFLAVVMFDSFSALNPLLILGSILSTFFPYCGVVIFFAGILSLGVCMIFVLPEVPLIYVLLELIFLYVLVDLAHGLGRFYYRYSDKLHWEV